MYQDPEHNHKAWVVAIVILFIVGLIGGLIAGVTIVKSRNKTYVKTNNQTGVAVDNVIVSATDDLADNLSQMKDANRFQQLINEAGMKDFLHSAGPLTVFLPQNSTLGTLDQKNLAQVESDANWNEPANNTNNTPEQQAAIQQKKQAKATAQATLQKLILTNVASGTYNSSDLRVMGALNQTITMLSGEKLKVQVVNKQIQLVDSFGDVTTLSPTDAVAANGVIHNSSHIMVPAGSPLQPPKSKPVD